MRPERPEIRDVARWPGAEGAGARRHGNAAPTRRRPSSRLSPAIRATRLAAATPNAAAGIRRAPGRAIPVPRGLERFVDPGPGRWRGHRAHADDISEVAARAALRKLDALWDELLPAEKARIVALMVERVEICTDGLNVRLRVDRLSGLAREMLADDRKSRFAPIAPTPRVRDVPRPVRRREVRRVQGDAGPGEYERIAPPCMTCVLRLTLLSPDIVKATIDGTQAPRGDAGAGAGAVAGGMERA